MDHGFASSGGVLMTLDYPGAALTHATDINNGGQVAGWYTDTAGVTHGFIASPAVAPTTSIASSPNPSVYGQAVTLTAVVSSGGSVIPTGTVTFMDSGVSSVLGTANLDSNGHGSYVVSTLTTGGHSIVAVYGGDSNFTGSTSLAVLQAVNMCPTTTSISSSLDPSNLGQSVTFTATVSGNGFSTPSGYVVSFMDGTNWIGSGRARVVERGERAVAI